jgi:hypothetical protein
MSLRAVMAKSRPIAKQVAELASVPANHIQVRHARALARHPHLLLTRSKRDLDGRGNKPGHDEGESVTELSTYDSYPFTGIQISKPPFPVNGLNVAS